MAPSEFQQRGKRSSATFCNSVVNTYNDAVNILHVKRHNDNKREANDTAFINTLAVNQLSAKVRMSQRVLYPIQIQHVMGKL